MHKYESMRYGKEASQSIKKTEITDEEISSYPNDLWVYEMSFRFSFIALLHSTITGELPFIEMSNTESGNQM